MVYAEMTNSTLTCDQTRFNFLRKASADLSIQIDLKKLGSSRILYDTILDEYLADIHRGVHLTPLHLAALTGDTKFLDELKEECEGPATGITGEDENTKQRRHSSHANVKTAGGFTPLHLAASRGNNDVIEFLLDWSSEEATVASEEGFTALHLAAFGGWSETVKLLLEARKSDSAYVNARDKVFGRTALHIAAGRGEKDIVRLLLDMPDVNVCVPDGVRKLTPLHLAAMHGWKGYYPKRNLYLDSVIMLLEKAPAQINDKVGRMDVTLVDIALQQFNERVWRKLELMGVDNRMRFPPLHDNEDTWKNLYRQFNVSMEGHTSLHLAATQNNVDIVAHLVKVPGIDLNVPDVAYGMTPLHCSILTEALDAFKMLMSVEGVDVNAPLLPLSLLPRANAVTRLEHNESRNEDSKTKMLQPSDTALHIAIRCSPVGDLLHIVTKFCNHSKFNSTVYNDQRWVPWKLAWDRHTRENSNELREVLEMLEQHPSNATLKNAVSDEKKASQDSINAVLVTATLLAGVTFSALLQPPFGTDGVGQYNWNAVRCFWILDCLSFSFALYTILCCLGTTMRTMRSTQTQVGPKKLAAHLAMRQAHILMPLVGCLLLALGAFVAAGYGNLPRGDSSPMLVCTIFGISLVFTKALHTLLLSIKMFEGVILETA
ncbi:hypothetical protein Mapa_007439 [Marchantia paleacea]|nr:hypothetical protein Mapa_007439 [Marchantia paleacea]